MRSPGSRRRSLVVLINFNAAFARRQGPRGASSATARAEEEVEVEEKEESGGEG